MEKGATEKNKLLKSKKFHKTGVTRPYFDDSKEMTMMQRRQNFQVH